MIPTGNRAYLGAGSSAAVAANGGMLVEGSTGKIVSVIKLLLLRAQRHVTSSIPWLVIGLVTIISVGTLLITGYARRTGQVQPRTDVTIDVNNVIGQMPPSLFGTMSMTFDINAIAYMNKEEMYKGAYLRFGNQLYENWIREGFENGTFNAVISESIKGGAVPIVLFSGIPQKFSSLCNPIPGTTNGFKCIDQNIWREYPDGFPGGPIPDWSKVHPKDYSAYSQYIGKIAGSLCRIGVRYFEPGNEQDSRDYWIDTRDNYYATTECIIRGIKAGCPDAKIVLPATARETIVPPNNFVEQNLHRFRGKNWIDMISWHSYYGYDGVWELNDRLGDFIKRMRRLLETNGYSKDIPLIVDEWSYGWGEEKTATEIGAATIGRFVRLFVDANVRHTYHLDRDIHTSPASRYKFGSTGLLTPYGVAKSTYNVFRALKRLDATRIAAVEGDPSFITALATKSDLRTSVIITNFENTRRVAQQQTVTLSLKNLVPGIYHLEVYLIDRDHSNSCRLNKKTEPLPTTRECGIGGLIDQKLKEAWMAAANAAEPPFKQYLANLPLHGTSNAQSYAREEIEYLWFQVRVAFVGDQSGEQSVNNIKSYCRSRGLEPEQCVTETINAFNKSTAKKNYDITLQQKTDAINDMVGVNLDKVTDSQITISGSSFQTAFNMQPYSVELAQLTFIRGSAQFGKSKVSK